MTDEVPDDRERAEAEALARALEGEPDLAAPNDVLETAALLRYARMGGASDAARLSSLREAVLSTAPTPRTTMRRLVPYAAVAVALAAAALLVFLPKAQRSAEPPPVASAPASAGPSSLAQLLDAQAAVLREPDASLTVLAQATARRRAEVLHEIAARQGGKP